MFACSSPILFLSLSSSPSVNTYVCLKRNKTQHNSIHDQRQNKTPSSSCSLCFVFSSQFVISGEAPSRVSVNPQRTVLVMDGGQAKEEVE
ncbi:hypothetical protein ATANTOWER_011825, partial [Ataeniobius toweri]|nr:hypothetical protein [Ataeniobius toweri]